MVAAAEPFGPLGLRQDSRAGEVDELTLEGCRRRDPAALRRFVLRYERLVFAFLSRSLGRGPHVEDLAQDVFLRACQALPRFDPHGRAKVSTWLLSVARNAAIDWRRRQRLHLVPLTGREPATETAGPETERRRHEIARAFERAAASLDDDQRDVFVLAEFHGLSMAEIGELCGIPENTAKTRLFRAREKLRALLAEVRDG
jgi:RNA polymerase sigma-70 factor (ECF subfamily)